MNFRHLPYLVVALGLTLGSAPVLAATDAPHRTVRYADLDLGKPSGNETLLRRLEAAAQAVCGAAAPAEFARRQQIAACRAQAIAIAAARIDDPRFARWYAARFGAAPATRIATR
jgi:UrcA family protein